MEINSINTTSKEGKWLMAALVMITTESRTDQTPMEVLDVINNLADEMFPSTLKHIKDKEFIPEGKGIEAEIDGLTTDRSDPELHEVKENGQNKKYLVLSEEERSKGFVRPLRDSYIHKPCGVVTKMSAAIAETYARSPKYYGATFCVGCGHHYPVSEFVWDKSNEVLGS